MDNEGLARVEPVQDIRLEFAPSFHLSQRLNDLLRDESDPMRIALNKRIILPAGEKVGDINRVQRDLGAAGLKNLRLKGIESEIVYIKNKLAGVVINIELQRSAELAAFMLDYLSLGDEPVSTKGLGLVTHAKVADIKTNPVTFVEELDALSSRLSHPNTSRQYTVDYDGIRIRSGIRRSEQA